MRQFAVATFGLLVTLISGGRLSGPAAQSDSYIDLTRCTSGVEYLYYDVTGTTRSEIRKQLLEKGPVDEKGERRFAFAAWTLEWDWPVEKDGIRRYSETRVSCKAHLVIPRFLPPKEADATFVESINKTLEKMREHELHHVQHAIEGAHMLRRALVSAAQQGKIQKEKQANRVAFRVIDSVKEFDVNYDQMTHYGETEGIWLK